MSQKVWSTINPETTSGTMLAALLTDFKDALMSGMAGTTRPAQLQPGGMWIDTTLQAAPTYYWIYKVWTGTVDAEVFRIQVVNNFGGALIADSLFELQQISDDTIGPIAELIKNRIAANGQVLSGDTVGEIQLVGCTGSGDNVTVGYVKWVSTDDEVAGAFGGTFSFYSTPDSSNAIAEHLKFISGLVEIPVPLVVNSLQQVSQDVATSAAIVQLSAAKNIVEFTGSTETEVQGINSGHDSKEVVLHNRSTAIVKLKHENGSAAAADRFHFPGDSDFSIDPDGTISVFYSSSDSRWKLKSTQSVGASATYYKTTKFFDSWTVPDGVTSINVTAISYPKRLLSSGFLDGWGNAFMMGSALGGRLGNGSSSVPASSPVAVIGGLNFIDSHTYNPANGGPRSNNTFAISKDGSLYAWGVNINYMLGVGDSVHRSSPVAVLGGLKFVACTTGFSSAIAITSKGAAYAWGENGNGQLGVGDTTDRSSPVAVLGNLNFVQIVNGSGNSSHDVSFVGIDRNGDVYAWGENGSAFNLGLGDTSNRNSPTLVLGGQSIIKIAGGGSNAGTCTYYAVASDGSLYAWGENGDGQVGNNSIVDQSTPVVVLTGVIDVWSDETSVIALKDDGTYYAWGQGGNGQLGVGDTSSYSSPVVALSGHIFEEIYFAQRSCFGLKSDGTLYSWGNNAVYGILGHGTVDPTSVPTIVVGGLKFAEISILVEDAVYAATVEGSIYAWGRNSNGELGVGDVVHRSSPVLVLGAHGTVPLKKSHQFSMEVTPSEVLNIRMGYGIGYIGNMPMGVNVKEVIIDYIERGT